MTTNENDEATRPVLHKLRGIITETLGDGIILLKRDPDQHTISKAVPLTIKVNLRSYFGDEDLEGLQEKWVLVYTSSLPEVSDDVVFGTLQVLESTSDYAGSVAQGQSPVQAYYEEEISAFLRTWTGLSALPPVFEGMARITFLFANTRYVERVKVRFTLQRDYGSIALIDSKTLRQFKLPAHYDSRFNTFSLRPGGSLCVICHDETFEDYVFWVNHGADEKVDVPLHYSKN